MYACSIRVSIVLTKDDSFPFHFAILSRDSPKQILSVSGFMRARASTLYWAWSLFPDLTAVEVVESNDEPKLSDRIVFSRFIKLSTVKFNIPTKVGTMKRCQLSGGLFRRTEKWNFIWSAIIYILSNNACSVQYNTVDWFVNKSENVTCRKRFPVKIWTIFHICVDHCLHSSISKKRRE